MNSRDINFITDKLGVKTLHYAVEIAREFSEFNIIFNGKPKDFGKFWGFGRSVMFLTNTHVLLFNKLGDKRPVVSIPLPDNFYNLISTKDYENILIPFSAEICRKYNENYNKFKL